MIGDGIVPKISAIDSYAPADVDIFHTTMTKGNSLGQPVERDDAKETGPK